MLRFQREDGLQRVTVKGQMPGVSMGNEVAGQAVKTGQEPVLGAEQWVGKACE